MKRLLMVLLSLLAASCSASPPAPSTRIDPATVNLEDHFRDQGRGDEHTVKINVTPAARETFAPPVLTPAATSPVYTPPPVAAPIYIPPSAASTAPVPEIKLGPDRSIAVPPGAAVSIDIHDQIQPQQTTHDRTASAAGPTLRTDKDAGSFSASAPQIKLSATDDTGAAGGESDGGGGSGKAAILDYSWTSVVNAVSAATTGQRWLWGIGILLIVAAVGMVVVEHIVGGTADWALFGLLVAGGIGFITVGIVAEKYPVFFLLLLLSAIGGGVWYVVYWKKRSDSAKSAVLPAVASTPAK